MIYMEQPTKAHTGQGIQFSHPGRTHHGNPMEKIHLGVTSLTDEIFLEYLDSLKPIYSPEAYDLFQHNCNNFTNDVAQFLCGRGIPDHIVSLPQTVLNTPFGQMLKPQLEQAMRPITTAPTPHAAYTQASRDAGQRPGASKVITANSLAALEKALSSAEASCAVVFFTSSTCGPCRSIYPRYEELAADAGSRAKLIKCDIGAAPDAALRYEISSTPTFVTFLKGEKVEEWVGASERDLQQRVDTLLRMAYPRKCLFAVYSRNKLNSWFSPPAHGYQAPHYIKYSHEADNIH
jgi:thiol-disulfide isomerase/thioredoxin